MERVHLNVDDADDDDDDEEEEGVPAPSVAAHLAAVGAGSTDEDEEDEDEPSPPAGPSSAAEERKDAEDPKAEDSAAEVLPSALDALDGATQEEAAFLHVDGPEFDASKGFKPPPVTARDYLPSVEGEASVSRAALMARLPREFPEASETQREHADSEVGTTWRQPEEQRRLRGSVCVETDDERGRRVVYGAHQMLKADPWSDCNPNYAMGHGPKGKRIRKH